MGQKDIANVTSAAEEIKPTSFLFSIRCVVAVLAAIGLAVQYAQRVNLTVGIVCMTNKTALKIIAQEKATAQILRNNSSINSTEFNATKIVSSTRRSVKKKKFKDGPFIWDRSKQGGLLAAYFVGYIALQVGGGVMAYKFGAFIVFLVAILVGSVFTLLIPVAACRSYAGVIVLRLLIGLFASIVWPTLVELIAQWSPKSEKSTMLAIGNSGAQLGPIVTLPISGLLCASSALGGWPLLFYVTGGVGILWCILWIIFVRSSPVEHKFISKAERAYILKGLPEKKEKKKQSGALSAVPYLCYWVSTIASGKIADAIINHKLMESTRCRKLFTGLGSFMPAILVFILGYVDEKKAWAGVLLFTLILIFLSKNLWPLICSKLTMTGLLLQKMPIPTTLVISMLWDAKVCTIGGCTTGGGMYVVVVDMAPQFAGILWGISNTFGTAPGIIIPLIIGAITKRGLVKEWRIVFILCAVSYVVSGLAFVLFASGERQPWAAEEDYMQDEAKEMLDTSELKKSDSENA